MAFANQEHLVLKCPSDYFGTRPQCTLLAPQFFLLYANALGNGGFENDCLCKIWWGGGEGVGLRECTMRHSKIENHLFPHTVKPLLSGHLRVVKIAQCLLTINIQRLLCTVIKLHVVKEAIQRSSSLPFITNFHLFVNAKTLTDFSTYFKDAFQYYYCKFSTLSA